MCGSRKGAKRSLKTKPAPVLDGQLVWPAHDVPPDLLHVLRDADAVVKHPEVDVGVGELLG